MKRLLLPPLVFVTASCTTNQSALFPPPNPPIEVHIIGGQAKPRRAIASTGEEQSALDAEFSDILNTSNPADAVKPYVQKIERVFYYSQNLLNAYDEKLDAAVHSPQEINPLLDETYAKLIAAWMITDEAMEKARFIYQRALETELERGEQNQGTREMRRRAGKINEAFRGLVLSAPNSTNRLAKQNLIRDMIDVNQAFREFQNKRDHMDTAMTVREAAFDLALKLDYISKPEDLQSFYERNAAQLAREVGQVSDDPALTSEIEKLLPDIKESLREGFAQGREPQSTGAFMPAPSTRGLINGLEFKRGVWAITFDDGPHETYTLQDLNNLRLSGTHTAFFWLANNISAHRGVIELVKRSGGMTLANHSFSHPQLMKLGGNSLAHEIDESTRVDIVAYGFQPRFFRCPYGACGPRTSVVRKKIADAGMIGVNWNVDSLDWQDHNPRTVYARVKKQMSVQKRGIILFHDIHPQSVAASKQVMADFAAGRKSGQYRTVTMDQAIDELNSSKGMMEASASK